MAATTDNSSEQKALVQPSRCKEVATSVINYDACLELSKCAKPTAEAIKSFKQRHAESETRRKELDTRISELTAMTKRAKAQNDELKKLQTERKELDQAGDAEVSAYLAAKGKFIKIAASNKHVLSQLTTGLVTEMLTKAGNAVAESLSTKGAKKTVGIDSIRSLDFNTLTNGFMVVRVSEREYPKPPPKKVAPKDGEAAVPTTPVPEPAEIPDFPPANTCEEFIRVYSPYFGNAVQAIWKKLKSAENSSFKNLKLSSDFRHYVSDHVVALLYNIASSIKINILNFKIVQPMHVTAAMVSVAVLVNHAGYSSSVATLNQFTADVLAQEVPKKKVVAAKPKA